MLRLVDLVKIYETKDLKVEALKGVNLCFRKSEFVAIVGPSGCGKTTLLNTLGGLDHYTSGDLLINGISTKNYTSHDWDVYRNHRIGFVFQSYNLIPHQNILSNVELTLTISGLPKKERIEKAKAALDRVGLAGLYNKFPNQLSGGQCQRVAIARALVNEPDILLADEPTGALDSKTSVQIMDLIKEISKDKLVIMVTHNDELAKTYATRIVSLKDGEVINDTDPFSVEEEAEELKTLTPIDPSKEKAKMSFWTAFKLSGKNLWSKAKRTALIVAASSIGIVGVASVLGISNGMTGYIQSQQDDMLSGYPINVSESSFDFSSLMSNLSSSQQAALVARSTEDGYIDVNFLIQSLIEQSSTVTNMVVSNEIDENYVKFVEDMDPKNYSAISMEYGINPANNIYTTMNFTGYDAETGEPTGEDVEKNYSVSAILAVCKAMLSTSETLAPYADYIDSLVTPFRQMVDNEKYVLNQYDVYATTDEDNPFPTSSNELVLVLDSNDMVSDLLLTELGYYSQAEFTDIVYYLLDKYDMLEEIAGDSEDVETSIKKAEELKTSFNVDEIFNKKLTWYPNDTVIANPYCMVYPFGSDEIKLLLGSYEPEITSSFTGGKELKIKTILTPKDSINYGCLSSGFYYTKAFSEEFIQQGSSSEVVNVMKENNLTSASAFELNGAAYGGISYTVEFYFDGKVQSKTARLGTTSTTDIVSSVMTSSASSSSLTIRDLGGETLPSSIDIYPVDFDSKYLVTDYLDQWNAESDITLSDGTVIPYNNYDGNGNARSEITYTDSLGLIISMVNSIISIVTYALVAFTSLALIVSTVMIGVITYVSVIERIKEIGVIRALGGRKRDVSNLFNVETAIIGLASGIFGIIVTYLLSIVINLIIGSLSGIYTISSLSWISALVCIAISVALTLISGLIPAASAAKKDPVVALRTE